MCTCPVVPSFSGRGLPRAKSNLRAQPCQLQRCTVVYAKSSEPGDQELQEELVDMIQVEVAKAKVKEDIMADLETRKEGLRKIGEEVRLQKYFYSPCGADTSLSVQLTEKLEKKLELDKMRMELASSSSLVRLASSSAGPRYADHSFPGQEVLLC